MKVKAAIAIEKAKPLVIDYVNLEGPYESFLRRVPFGRECDLCCHDLRSRRVGMDSPN